MQRKAKKGKDTLTQAIRAGVYVRRSGREFDVFRKDISNGHVSRSREQPCNVSESNRKMEHCKLLFHKKNKDQGRGSAGSSQNL